MMGVQLNLLLSLFHYAVQHYSDSAVCQLYLNKIGEKNKDNKKIKPLNDAGLFIRGHTNTIGTNLGQTKQTPFSGLAGFGYLNDYDLMTGFVMFSDNIPVSHTMHKN